MQIVQDFRLERAGDEGVQKAKDWFDQVHQPWLQARFRLREDGSDYAWRDLIKGAFEGVEWQADGDISRLRILQEQATKALEDDSIEDKAEWIAHSQAAREDLENAQRALRNCKDDLKFLVRELNIQEQAKWKLQLKAFQDFMVLDSSRTGSGTPSEAEVGASFGGSGA